MFERYTPEDEVEEKTAPRLSIREELQNEGIECPPISFNVFLDNHGDSATYKKIENAFLEGDLLFPEVIASPHERYIDGGSAGMLSFANVIDLAAQGAIKEEDWKAFLGREKGIGPFHKALWKSIRDSKKKLFFVDLSPEDGKNAEFIELGDTTFGKNTSQAAKRYAEESGTFGEFAEKVYLLFKKFGELQRKREISFLANMRKDALWEIANTPELRNKKQIVVSVFMGAAHTGIYHMLKSSEKNVTLITPKQRFDDAHPTDIYPRFGMFDIEPDENNKLYFALSWLIHRMIKKIMAESMESWKEDLKLLCKPNILEKIFIDYKSNVTYGSFTALKSAYLKL